MVSGIYFMCKHLDHWRRVYVKILQGDRTSMARASRKGFGRILEADLLNPPASSGLQVRQPLKSKC